MQLKRLWRSLVAYGAVAVLAAQFLGAVNPQLAHAATPTLRINEINWAGSQGHPTDEWVELHNVSGAPIDFNATPYTLQIVVGGTPQTIATLGTTDGILNTDNFLVLHKEVVPSVNSTLTGASANTRYIQKTTLTLPDGPTEYQLLDNTNAVEDSIQNSGAGLPFAGSAGSATTPIASMSRVNDLLDGNLPSNWYTAQTMGVNFLFTAPLQFGTPGEANVEVPVPHDVVITPADSTTQGTGPTITGTTDTGVTHVTATFTRASYTPVPYTQTYNGIFASANGGPFSITPTAPPIDPGRYLIDLYAKNVAGDRSATVHVMVAVGVNEFNYVIIPTSSYLPTPTIDPHAPATNQPSITLTGSVDNTAHVYNSIEVLRDGRYYGTLPMHADGMTFGGSFNLLPNQTNTFSFMAVDTFGTFSLPVAESVISDTIAPNPVDANKVVVHANPAGTADTIAGLPAAAEPMSTLWVYGDAALTQQIASTQVALNGSFPELAIGDNLYDRVYLVLSDAAGNRSAATVILNPTGYVGGSVDSLHINFAAITDNMVTATWTQVSGASAYRVKYRLANGDYGTPATVCTSGNATCNFTITINGLQQDTSYVIAIAALDRFGNESPYVERGFKTLSRTAFTGVGGNPGGTTVSSTVPSGKGSIASNSGTTGGTDNIQKNTEASPSPSPTNEQGEVKSTTDDKTRNWTPWIILAILIGIAVLATAGYFYWFGGEAGEAALASASRDQEKAAPTPRRRTSNRKTSDKAPPKRGGSKRW